MAIYHEDEVLGKAYDKKLMKRLLKYAWPYRRFLAVCIALLFLITGLDLLQPYLIKVAIDNHMNALTEPMLAFAPGDEPRSGISFDEYVFGRGNLREVPRLTLWDSEDYPARIEQEETTIL